MQPYAIVEEGPRGGLKKTSVVDVWMMHPQRAQIDASPDAVPTSRGRRSRKMA